MEDVKKLRLRGHEKLIKLDVKEFFMSGEHAQLSEAASHFAEDGWQGAARSTASYLLGPPYVTAVDQSGSPDLSTLHAAQGRV